MLFVIVLGILSCIVWHQPPCILDIKFQVGREIAVLSPKIAQRWLKKDGWRRGLRGEERQYPNQCSFIQVVPVHWVNLVLGTRKSYKKCICFYYTIYKKNFLCFIISFLRRDLNHKVYIKRAFLFFRSKELPTYNASEQDLMASLERELM